MLAVSPLSKSDPCERAGDAGSTSLPVSDDFSADFDFDFSELITGLEDGEVLPVLEVDHSEIMAYFPLLETVAVVVETMEAAAVFGSAQQEEEKVALESEEMASVKFEKVLSGGMMEEVLLKMLPNVTSSPGKEKRRKPSAGLAKGSTGKRKMKVDWMPELHRKFVQAVEQLGVEKAVPSKILELMETDRLTRHNVASHLQKYRSSRKHMLLIREAEAASQCQKRQTYTMIRTTTTTTIGNTIVPMGETSPCMLAPTMGFPQGAPLSVQMTPYRSLHVRGHPTIDQSPAHMWLPKHLFTILPTPSSPWVSPNHQFTLPHHPPHSSPWSTHFSSGTMTQGRSYFPQQVPALRFTSPPVSGIPLHSMYQPEDALFEAIPLAPELAKLTGRQLHHESHPSKERIDASIGEVLAQPWLPMSLGLKPPSLESLMLELQKQGIPTVPPFS